MKIEKFKIKNKTAIESAAIKCKEIVEGFGLPESHLHLNTLRLRDDGFTFSYDTKMERNGMVCITGVVTDENSFLIISIIYKAYDPLFKTRREAYFHFYGGGLTQEKRRKIYRRLKSHYGAIEDVALKTGLSVTYIKDMFEGRTMMDSGVLRAAWYECAERDAKEERDHQYVLAKMAKMNIA